MSITKIKFVEFLADDAKFQDAYCGSYCGFSRTLNKFAEIFWSLRKCSAKIRQAIFIIQIHEKNDTSVLLTFLK